MMVRKLVMLSSRWPRNLQFKHKWDWRRGMAHRSELLGLCIQKCQDLVWHWQASGKYLGSDNQSVRFNKTKSIVFFNEHNAFTCVKFFKCNLGRVHDLTRQWRHKTQMIFLFCTVKDMSIYPNIFQKDNKLIESVPSHWENNNKLKMKEHVSVKAKEKECEKLCIKMWIQKIKQQSTCINRNQWVKKMTRNLDGVVTLIVKNPQRVQINCFTRLKNNTVVSGQNNTSSLTTLPRLCKDRSTL